MKGLSKAFPDGSAMERMDNNMIAKRAYVGDCAGSHLLSSLWKRWFDTVTDCLKKRGLDVR